jgi:4,5-DOPA dioxygenase extradiol
MNRNEFFHQTALGLLAMNSLNDLRKFSDTLDDQATRLPALFVGHGSPMNGIEDNSFSSQWEALGKTLPVPAAVLCISAHWFTRGTHITAMENPKTIHDFYGFPQALFDVQYPAPGNPALAKETAAMIHKTTVGLDHEWGLDHGTWSIVKRMYPKANIPVLQLSIDYTQKPSFHYELAKELSALRRKGVLIIGSGNMVHNLRMIDWHNPEGGFDWAVEMNDTFKRLITNHDHQALIQYEALGTAARYAIPTPEHYLPLLYVLGLKEKSESASFFNDKSVMGSLTMTSVKIA